MKLTYRIIWVDDTPDWVESVKDEITEHLEELGYEPTIQIFEGGENLEQRCTVADLDLIVIDYNLPDENGDLLISRLRDSGNFTEIVFYSQDRPSRELIGVMDGVFHCQRDEAVEKINRVIDLTLHKLRDLGVVRGLVIATAIDLEITIEEIMVNLFGNGGELFRDRVLAKPWLDFGKKASFLQGVIKDRIKECDPGQLKDRLTAAQEIMKQFDKEIVEQRNILAHSRRTEKDGKVVLEGVNTRTRKVEFGNEWLAKVRADLRKHQENLDTLQELLQTE